MIAAIALGSVLLAGQLAAPDSFVIPLVTDPTAETELQIFPPANVMLPAWYQVSWGDGDTLDWSGPLRSPTDISRYHQYRNPGEFLLSVRVRDSLWRMSEWSIPVIVKVTEPILKWAFPTEEPIVASPALDLGGNVYIGDESGSFYSLTPDGSLRWSYATRGPVYASASVDGDRVYFGSTDSSLYCLDTTGRKLWSIDLGDEFYSAPAIAADGTIYTTSDKGTFAAISRDGRKLWTYEAGDEIAGSPTIGASGLIYFAADSVYCLDPKGRRRWAFGTAAGDYFFASPVVGYDGTVYVGNTDGNLYCLDENGRQRWNSPVPDGDEIRPEIAVGLDSAFYFGTDGYYLCRAVPGEPPAVIFEADDILIATAAVSATGTIFYFADDGVLYGRTPDGRLYFERDVCYGSKEIYYTPAPTIAPDGTIYVASWDGGVFAFRGDGPPARTLWAQYRHDAQHTGRLGGDAGTRARRRRGCLGL